MSKVMLSVSDAFLRDMDALARAERRSRSELVREAIRAYVATRVIIRPGAVKTAVQQAAARILNTRLRFPTGQTAQSLVRRARERRSHAS